MPVNNSDFFKKYKNHCNYFVETGTFQGLGVSFALEAGFNHIKSIELNYQNYDNCFERFKHASDIIELYHGASENLFWSMIKNINEPIMFWLDSHYSGCGDNYVTSKGKSFTSLCSELKTIAKHPIKNHIILIDDIRDFGTQNMDYLTLSDVKELIWRINPFYTLGYDTGDNSNELFKNDILVAMPPKE